MSRLLEQPWLPWALLLAVGLPLLVVVLGEIAARLKQRNNGFAAPLLVVRNYLLPILAVVLLLRFVVELPVDHIAVRILLTLFWMLLIVVALSLLNALLFANAKAGSWRGRMPGILIDLVRAILIAVGCLAVFTAVWGADFGRFFAALGVSSIVLGLVLQRSLGNVIAGLLLLAERPFQVGEWLKIGDVIGRVVEINWRAAHVDIGNQLLIVPNGMLADTIFTNLSRPSPLSQVTVQLPFDGTYPPNRVKAMIRRVLQETPDVLAEPEPVVGAASSDRTSINYTITFYVDDYSGSGAVRDAFLTRLWYVMQRSNLPIVPSPAATVAEELQAALKQVAPLLNANSDEITQLAPRARVLRFAAGETIMRQGEILHGFYIILNGHARLLHEDRRRTVVQVVNLGRNDHFGEAALTGNRAGMSVVADDDVRVLCLDSDDVNALLDNDPRLAHDLDKVVENRHRLAASIRGGETQRQN
jgi:small-conductance mechanosensitive channel